MRAWPRVPEQLLHVAIEHRLMHAETFAYMLHHLPFEQKVRTGGPLLERRGRPAEPRWWKSRRA